MDAPWFEMLSRTFGEQAEWDRFALRSRCPLEARKLTGSPDFDSLGPVE